jgi:hypothetical protein
MTLAHVTTHITQGLDLLLEQFKNKPKLAAVLTAYLRQVQELEDALWDLRLLKTAEALSGEALNQLGRVVGQAREGRDDPTYRLWIRARARVNRSFGKPIDVIEVAKILVGADVSVRLQELWPASMIVHAGDQVASLGGEMAKLLRQTKAAGVALHFHWSESGRTFRFAPGDTVVSGSEQGFGAPASVSYVIDHALTPGYFATSPIAFSADGTVGLVVGGSGLVARSATVGVWSESDISSALTGGDGNITAVAWNPSGLGAVVVGGNSSGAPAIAYTLDGGATWLTPSVGLPGVAVNNAVVHLVVNDGSVDSFVALFDDGAGGTTFAGTADGGDTWSVIGVGPATTSLSRAVYDNTGVPFFLTASGVWDSNNGLVVPPGTGFVFTGGLAELAGTLWMVGVDDVGGGGQAPAVWSSVDGGASWVLETTTGLSEPNLFGFVDLIRVGSLLVAAAVVDPGAVAAIYSSPDGLAWTAHPDTIGLVDVAPSQVLSIARNGTAGTTLHGVSSLSFIFHQGAAVTPSPAGQLSSISNGRMAA